MCKFPAEPGTSTATAAGIDACLHLIRRELGSAVAAETRTTPVQWLTAQRVLHAQRLLEDTPLDIDEVANRCGFATAALVRHHFRRAAGVTPTDYGRSFEPASHSR